MPLNRRITGGTAVSNTERIANIAGEIESCFRRALVNKSDFEGYCEPFRAARQKITPPADERQLAFVVYFGKTPEYKEAAVRTVAALRHNSIKAEMAYGDRSAKSQMKQANNTGAAYAVLIGEKELDGDFVTIKDLQAEGLGTESKKVEVRREELVGHLSRG